MIAIAFRLPAASGLTRIFRLVSSFRLKPEATGVPAGSGRMLERPDSAIARVKAGMSSIAGHFAAQGATHSPAWSESSSSSAIRRAVRTSSVSVRTTIPSAAGRAQEGDSVRRPSIWTTHTKQEATGSNPTT